MASILGRDGERIVGISTESGHVKVVFVIFRTKIKLGIVGVVPRTARVELYLYDIVAKELFVESGLDYGGI